MKNEKMIEAIKCDLLMLEKAVIKQHAVTHTGAKLPWRGLLLARREKLTKMLHDLEMGLPCKMQF